jgi:hypothetical protein
MDTKNKAFVFIYRMQKRGLEVLLLNESAESKNWNLPLIEEFFVKDIGLYLDPIYVNGQVHQAYALEDKLFEKPSTQSLLTKFGEKGAYFSIKDCLKQMFPNQHAFLKELRDIMQEKNLVLNL